MSDLNTSFTFRLTHGDKAALGELASRVGKDRGAVLRQIIRLSRAGSAKRGVFTVQGRVYPVRLQSGEQTE